MVFLLPFMVACLPGVGSKVEESSSTEGQITPQGLSPEDFQKAFRRASLIFLKRSPDLEQLARISSKEDYDRAIRDLVDSPEFISTMRQYHQEFFDMSGQTMGINYNEPANLAAYLIRENRDFRDILRATYCVNDELETGDCSSFSREPEAQATYAAGAITTQGFLHRWVSSFNFERTRETLKAFACHDYPDGGDPGMTGAEVETGVHTWECSNCVPSCYSCHSTMNPRATLFYDFDRNGQFNRQPANNVATQTDTETRSERTDLLIDGVAPRFNGRVMANLRQYAVEFSETPKFASCLARRLTLFSIGGGLNARVPDQFSFAEDLLQESNFRVRDFYLGLLTRDEYVRH